MNVDTAKRVVAILRQQNAYGAMVKRGDLTADEARILVEPLLDELKVIRSQAVLPFKTDPAPKSGKSVA